VHLPGNKQNGSYSLFWTLECFSNISDPFADRKDVAGVGYIAAFFNDVVTTHVHTFYLPFVVLINDEYHVGIIATHPLQDNERIPTPQFS